MRAARSIFTASGAGSAAMVLNAKALSRWINCVADPVM
jgi:hypothetical protein